MSVRLKRSTHPAKCKLGNHRTYWRTLSGKVICPECLNWQRVDISEAEINESMADALYGLVDAFGARIIPTPPPRPVGPIPIKQGPCSWCAKPGIGIMADAYLHCKAHLWPPFRWPPPNGAAA